ncbi:MAG: hypothetical protein ABL996_19435 [Micropepsaceae bacterium]
MTDHRDIPRISINWSHFRPRTWRDWFTVAGFVAFAIAVFALIAIVASTLLVVALIVGTVTAASLFIGNLFRRPRGRDVEPYQGNNYDA